MGGPVAKVVHNGVRKHHVTTNSSLHVVFPNPQVITPRHRRPRHHRAASVDPIRSSRTAGLREPRHGDGDGKRSHGSRLPVTVNGGFMRVVLTF